MLILFMLLQTNVMGPPTYISPTPGEYCIRDNKLNHSFGKVRDNNTRNHQAHDLRIKFGAPVVSVTNTKVLTISSHINYGLNVLLKEINGDLYFLYAHLSDVSVSVNENLDYGTIVGFSGKSGNAANLPKSAIHLHFEVRTRRYVGQGLYGRISPFEIYPEFVKSSFKCK